MRVVVVDQKGPKVNGFFTLATEIFDDSGAPHTLEHLCFMGSKNYQYKGVLDKLATRAYSNTNAWTATDHTAYTLDTAGWEGFAQILPIYLEHVILPTLTDAGCYTEVHHVDGEGNDAGVVYSEMQGVQNEQGFLMDLKSKRLLYPKNVGFRYETGGMMEQLRVLTADRIRSFHKAMYQPKNLCIVIVGAVDHLDMLGVLDKFEQTILSDISPIQTPFKRPWIDSPQVPALQKTYSAVVEFPEEDESMGEIMITFWGPPHSEILLHDALAVVLRYLCGSAASILDNTLVEKEQLASGVSFYIEDKLDSTIQFSINSVETERLEEVEERFFQVIEEAATKPLDMKFVKDCVAVERRQAKFNAESSAEFFTDPIIKDFLFGNRNGTSLKDELKSLKEFDVLDGWEEQDWRQLIQTWFSKAHHVAVLGKPSGALAQKLKDDEEARIAARKEKLGQAGLEQLKEKLAAAMAENEKTIPEGILKSFHVPGTDSINFIDTMTARSGLARHMGPLENSIQHIIDRENPDLPLFLHFEHIQTNFAHIELLVSTEQVPDHLRPLLSVYMETFFALPMVRDGKRTEYEQVVMELDRDTVNYGMNTGRGLGNSEAIRLSVQVEIEEYATAVRWLKELMFSSVFDLDRIVTTTQRLLADIPGEKRSGDAMMQAIDEMLIAKPASINRALCTLVQALYLKHIKHQLKTEPEIIIDQFKAVNSALWQPSNFRILVIADIEKLPDPVSTWSALKAHLENPDLSKPLPPLETRLSRLSDLGKSPGNAAYIIPLPTIDSSFAMTSAKAPSSYEDPAIPALLVATAFLNAVEGPLWTAVRGTGLAYGCSLRQHRDAGQISLEIYRSPDAFKAYIAAKSVIEGFAMGKVPINPLDLEGAISSIVLDFANGESTLASAAQVSFVRQVVRGQEKDYPKRMLEKVRAVAVEEVKERMKGIILPLFDAAKSVLVVTCAPIMQDNLEKGFKEVGLKPEVKALADFQDDYGFKSDGGEDEDDDDDDNDADEEEGGDEEEEEDEVEDGKGRDEL